MPTITTDLTRADRPAFAWMNEISRQFLAKDYLLNGQSGEARVGFVADAFGRRSGRPELAAKFYDYMGRGWYSLSSPVWSNYGLTRGLPISCVVGETWINTLENGGKQARDIVVGDMVLTHRGRYRPVTKVMVTENRSDIYRLKVNGRMTPLHLTGDHLVLTNLGWVRTDQLDRRTHLVAINREVDMVESDYTIDLEPYCEYRHVLGNDGRLRKAGSATVRANRRVATVSYCAAPQARVSVDADLAWALGVWFAEGSVQTGADGKPNGFRVTVKAEEANIAERWRSVMESKFSVNGYSNPCGVKRNGKDHKWHVAGVNSHVVGAFFASFGGGCKDKTMPQWVLNLPRHLLREFLDGLLVGDGSWRAGGANRLTLANPRLVLQAYQISLKLGLSVSLQMQEKAGKLATTAYVYTLLFLTGSLVGHRQRPDAAVKFHDGLSYSTIRELDRTDRTTTVYDFTVEEDHSFSAAGVVLHNCFGSYVNDNMQSILKTHAEVGMMSKYGGGTSVYLSHLRPRGSAITDNGESSGSVHFAQLFDTAIRVISQGSARRGECAVYWDIDHPDVPEALAIRTPASEIQKLSYGVCITDAWMRGLVAGDPEKRERWALVVKARMKTGYPYLIFIDNANKAAPPEYKEFGLSIKQSNLCTEIFLSNGPAESFVCCLSSMNMLYLDEWRDTDAVAVMVTFLDTVMDEFIEKARGVYGFDRAVVFAERQRALGLGQIGWHSYLQSRLVPYDSLEANGIAARAARTIQAQAFAASAELARTLGEPDYLKGRGRRHMTLTAIAPTQSSSAILGQVSEGIEALIANFAIKDKQKVKYTYRNPFLLALLAEKGKDTPEVIESVFANQGSVRHLDFLSPAEKAVFKTLREISPMAVVQQAAARQPYVCQGQSLNLLIDPAADLRQVNKVYVAAWELGLKSLYYQKNVSAAQELVHDLTSCSACEG